MGNLVELLANETGEIDVILTEANRYKLARMKSFLATDEELLENMDHFDIANLSEDEMDVLLSKTTEDEYLNQLPREIVGRLEMLADKRTSAKSLRVIVALAACFILVFLAGASNFSFSSQSPSPILTAAVPPIHNFDRETPVEENFRPGSEFALANAFVTDGQDQQVRLSVVSTPLSVQQVSYMGSPIADISSDSGREISFPAQNTALVESASVDSQTWVPLVGSQLPIAFQGNYLGNRDALVSYIKSQFEGDAAITEMESTSGFNVIVRRDGVELHFFWITLTEENPNPFLAAETVSLDPNVFKAISDALVIGENTDPTRLQINDNILGVVVRYEGETIVPKMLFENRRGAQQYSDCASLNAVEFLSYSMNQVERCAQQASLMAEVAFSPAIVRN